MIALHGEPRLCTLLSGQLDSTAVKAWRMSSVSKDKETKAWRTGDSAIKYCKSGASVDRDVIDESTEKCTMEADSPLLCSLWKTFSKQPADNSLLASNIPPSSLAAFIALLPNKVEVSLLNRLRYSSVTCCLDACTPLVLSSFNP